MNSYQVTAPIHLFAGRIGVTKKQAKVRAHNLKKVGGGIYEICGPVCFKAGEIIAFNCDKATLLNVELVNGNKADTGDSVDKKLKK